MVPAEAMLVSANAVLLGRFEIYLPAGNYSVRARVSDATGAYAYSGPSGSVSISRAPGATDASSLVALSSLTDLLDRLSRASQLLMLSSAVADGLDLSAAAVTAAAAAGGGENRRRRLMSSAAYREAVCALNICISYFQPLYSVFSILCSFFSVHVVC